MRPQVVWFKRDLRVFDHRPLALAARRRIVLPLAIVEPDYWKLPDTSFRQWQFWSGAIEDLTRHCPLVVKTGAAVDVFKLLKAEVGTFDLHAHEETGNAWTFERDRAVRAWCEEQSVAFAEQRQFGVWRGRGANRDRWATMWDSMMSESLVPPPVVTWLSAASEAICDLGLPHDGIAHPQTPTRAAGLGLLHTFLHERGQNYTREMSSPVTGEHACSRLSPYFAYGLLSIREAAQAAQKRYQELEAEKDGGSAKWRQAIRSFIARLHWHCHFIQKLEMEPEAEWRPFSRLHEDVRPKPGNPDHLEAWAEGRTGYPFIDACMRYLMATGWINFRMRAMLMSFATYDLWLPWQEAGLVLACYFTDYEPGIHWPQSQMQAGETGINTIRIYSPVKQGLDQDPNGEFIRRWVPELAAADAVSVHEPWKTGGVPGYPPPIVDHKLAAAFAKEQLYALRKKPETRAQADAIQKKHGSRKRTADRKRSAKRAPVTQLQFDM
jgi:deoxyribodipyrimidine photo-lyase